MASKDQTIKKKMTLEVVNPYEVFYEGRIERIVIPTLDGQYGIMPGHAPLVIAVTPGIATFECDGEKKTFAISEGFAEIGQHVVGCNHIAVLHVGRDDLRGVAGIFHAALQVLGHHTL